MSQTQIVEFLTQLPPLSKLEEEAGIPKGVLSKAIRGKRDLTQQHIQKLIPTLNKYGFKNQDN